MKIVVPIAALAALCAGCSASRPRPAPVAPRQTVSLPRSSIAAVLAHREELQLDDYQVKELERIDAELHKRNEQTRKEFGERPGATTTESPATRERPPGRRRGFTGPGGEPGGSRSAYASDRARGASRSALERALDDNDTQAFLTAEPLLREAQRDRAKDVAESYREALFESREQQRSGDAAAGR